MGFLRQMRHMKLGATILVIEILLIILFGTMTKYDDDRDRVAQPFRDANKPNESEDMMEITYSMFQDVHVMIFLGFGFLMTFLKKYSYGSVGFNMMISAIGIQWSMLVFGWLHIDSHDEDYDAQCRVILNVSAPVLPTEAPRVSSNNPFIDPTDNPIPLNLGSLLGADFAIAAVLISYGAVLGKVSHLQLVVMTMIELVLYNVNEWIGRSFLHAVDAGDSIFVHSFGAYFGITVARVLYRTPMHESLKEGATYTSNLFAMVGTLFLWMYWPSFNSGATAGHEQHRAVINTYLALAASAGTAVAVSSMVHPEGKLNMIHVQNSTLAGGVAVGAMADMMIQPWGALLVGVVSGAISVLGYEYVTLWGAKNLGTHDTCGVNNLHGVPALIAGVGSAIVAGVATEEKYGSSLYRVFPAMAPQPNEALCRMRINEGKDVFFGLGWSSLKQGGHQMAAQVVTLVFALVGGIFTGLIMRLSIWDNPNDEQLYDDEDFWKLGNISKTIKDGRKIVGEDRRAFIKQ